MRTISVILLTLVLTACTSGGGDDEPDPEVGVVQAAAKEVADAIMDDSLGDLAWAEMQSAQVAEEYDDTVAGLGGLEPTVTVGDVTVTGAEGEATLAWEWPVGRAGDVWTYESSLAFQQVSASSTNGDDAADGDVWLPEWSRSIVEPSLGEAGELLVRTDAVDRGRITGAGGAVIVTERPVLRFGIDKTLVGAKRAVADARALARLVDVDASSYADQVRVAGDRAFVEAITYREDDVPDAARSGVDDIKGARAIEATMSLAPTRDFAAPILGRVGPVTAEMVEEAPEQYQVGDIAGVSGLQARYDDQLRGSPGVSVVAFDPGGEERELFAVDAVPGEDLALTLDPRLQRTAEDLLAPIGPAASLVAIRPSDGAILAAANGPGTGGLNHATFGQFAPGSTFKIVSSLALMRAGMVPNSTVECPASITVDGKEFENYDDYPSGFLGPIPLRTAVAQSCNTAFIGQADELDDDALADAAASLGHGVDHDLGFPAYFGQVPEPASETEKAADLIGQGKVLASPMVMAAVIASVQEGAVVVPRLVEQVDVSVHDHEPLSGREPSRLQSMLREVVTEGSGRALADVPGPPVIAKTGTAEFEGDDGLQTHAWMVAAQGDLAVAAFVEVGESGSGTAGPILEAFLRAAQ